MAKQSIFVGSLPNDGTGDTLRDAMIKCNDNFTELYNAHAPNSGYFTVPYGDIGPVAAGNSSVFEHNSQQCQFTITTQSGFNVIRIALSAPSILLGGNTQGPVTIQRVVNGVATNIHGIYVSSVDVGYQFTYDDIHNLSVGTEVTYRLFNNTGSGGTAGTVQFVTSYGFQFSGREV